ncbi:MAG: hypothetical protein QW332_06120 [Thermoproteota archaeon]
MSFNWEALAIGYAVGRSIARARRKRKRKKMQNMKEYVKNQGVKQNE